MKKNIFLFILILIQACKPEPKKQLEIEVVEKPAETIVKEIELNRAETVTKIEPISNEMELDINYIKSKTSPLTEIIDIENINVKELEKIPKKFIENYLTPHKLNFGFPEYLPSDYPESYAFNEFKEFDKFYLFTFIHDNETCCRTLYAATTDKEKLKIISIGVIGYEGADGGWIGKKIGKWTRETIIETVESSSYNEDLEENNNNTEIDTTWSVIKTGQNGFLENTDSHTVKYIGNKKIE